jgi:DeoR/GlpR family transcriptional regulator of sugar metabolism
MIYVKVLVDYYYSMFYIHHINSVRTAEEREVQKTTIEERRRTICELLKSHKVLTVERLSKLLGASPMTIRRDLELLGSQGFIQRIHGGAAVRRSEDDEPPYTIREREMQLEKQGIGLKAASLVGEREVILIDIGSTLLSLIRSLPLDREITVVTHWMPVVLEMRRRAASKIIFLGGEVNFGELSTTGGYTEEMLENFHADKLFLGVAGVSPEFGLTDYNTGEIQVKRQMIKCATKVIVLADHSKFGRVAPLKVANLGSVHQIVTDDGIAEADRRAVESVGVEVLVAGRPGQHAGVGESAGDPGGREFGDGAPVGASRTR